MLRRLIVVGINLIIALSLADPGLAATAVKKPITPAPKTVKTTAVKKPAPKVIPKKKPVSKPTTPVCSCATTPKTPAPVTPPPIVSTTPIPTVPQVTPTAPVQEAMINDKSIILSGDEVMEIKNKYFVQKGDIILKDRAKLKIINSVFEHRNTPNATPQLYANQAAEITILDSSIYSDDGINWNITDKASLVLNNVAEPTNRSNSRIYYHLTKDARVVVIKSPFKAGLNDQVEVAISESPDVFLTLYMNGGAIVNSNFPEQAKEFRFPASAARNLSYKLAIDDSRVSQWQLMAFPTSDITIRDTKNLNLGIIIAWPWDGLTATFENVRPGYYDYKTMRFSQTNERVWDRNSKFTLINTTVNKWIPLVGYTNTIVIKNSDVAEIGFGWDQGTVVLENSTSTYVRAHNNMTIRAKNSTLVGDIIAETNGTIYLSNNTKVIGQKIARSGGQIIEQ